jgi:tRNA dimethylallyltransferase
LYTAIVQFAKRQMTFFRKLEKDGLTIHWTNANETTKENTIKRIEAALKSGH